MMQTHQHQPLVGPQVDEAAYPEEVEVNGHPVASESGRDDFLMPAADGDAWRLIRDYGPRLLVVKRGAGVPDIHVLDPELGIWDGSVSALTHLHLATLKVYVARLVPVLLDDAMKTSLGKIAVHDVVKWGRASSTATGATNCAKLIYPAYLEMQDRRIPNISIGGVIAAQRLDANYRFLGCSNGVVDLDTGALLSPLEAALHFVSRSTGIPYDPDARHAAIDSLLDHLDDDSREYILNAAAYALRGNPARRWYLLVGEGGSGKTTFLSAIRAAVGEVESTGYGFGMLPGLLLKRIRGGGVAGHTEGIKNFHVGLIATSSELPSGTGSLGFDESLLKMLTGGDDFPSRSIFKGTGSSNPSTATIFQAINPSELRRLNLADRALAERTAILNWPSFPPGMPRDPQRVETVKSIEAAQAMLAILVKRAKDLHRPPAVPTSVAQANEEHRLESIGPVGQWLQRHVILTGQMFDHLQPDDIWSALELDHQADDDGRIHGLDRKETMYLLREVNSGLPPQTSLRVQGKGKVKAYRGIRFRTAEELAALDEDDDVPCVLCGNVPTDGVLFDTETGECSQCWEKNHA